MTELTPDALKSPAQLADESRLERERTDVLAPAFRQFNPTTQVVKGFHDRAHGQQTFDENWRLTPSMLETSLKDLGVTDEGEAQQFRDYADESLSQADFDHRVSRFRDSRQDMADVMADGIGPGLGAILLAAITDPTAAIGPGLSGTKAVMAGLKSASRARRGATGAAIGGTEALAVEGAIAFGNPHVDGEDLAIGTLLGTGIGGALGAAMRKLGDGSPEELAHDRGQIANFHRIMDEDNGMPDEGSYRTAEDIERDMDVEIAAREAEEAADDGPRTVTDDEEIVELESDLGFQAAQSVRERLGPLDEVAEVVEDAGAQVQVKSSFDNAADSWRHMRDSMNGALAGTGESAVARMNMGTLKEIAIALGVKPARSKKDTAARIEAAIAKGEPETAAATKVTDPIERALMDPKRMPLDELKRTAVRMGIELPEGCK